jgi:hypothetical protein
MCSKCDAGACQEVEHEPRDRHRAAKPNGSQRRSAALNR